MATTFAKVDGARQASLVWRGLAAAAASAAVNAMIFWLAWRAGVFPAFRLDPAAGPQMAVELVVFVSVAAALAGIGVFALVRRRAAQPLRVFLWIAAVVLALSFVPPFALPGTVAQALVLNAMHIVVAVFVAGVAATAGGRTG